MEHPKLLVKYATLLAIYSSTNVVVDHQTRSALLDGLFDARISAKKKVKATNPSLE